MKTQFAGSCNHCGAWAEMLDRHRLCPVCHVKRDDALESLREACGVYCERLPAEVAAALHAIPFIEKQHPAHDKAA